jgi:hypothetical protein
MATIHVPTTCVQNKVFRDLNKISSTRSTQLLSYQPFFLPARKKKINGFFYFFQSSNMGKRTDVFFLNLIAYTCKVKEGGNIRVEPVESNKFLFKSGIEHMCHPTRCTAHGTGAVQAGTPQIPASNLTARGLLKQQAAFNQLRKMQPKRNH